MSSLVAFTASQRTRELGIRVALGARRGSVLWMVIRQGVALTLVGLAVGTAGALLLTRSIGSWLYSWIRWLRCGMNKEGFEEQGAAVQEQLSTEE